MRDEPPTTRHTLDQTRRLVTRAPGIGGACALDLLVFLYRHPRALLTNENLATFVGYDMKQVADALDRFIEAGLLKRTQNAMHNARMYLLVLDGPRGGGLRELLELASTREGRRNILQVLGAGPSGGTPVAQHRWKPHAMSDTLEMEQRYG